MKLLQHATNLVVSRDYGLGGNGAHLVIPSIIGPILAGVLVLNRIYWRITLVNAMGSDDVCILLSLIFLFAQCTVNLVAVDSGYGRPADTLSTPDLHRAIQMFYLDQIFYKFTINLTKLSILALYLRIFTTSQHHLRWFRLTCYTCAVLVTGYAIASTFVTIFQCMPISRVWDKTVPGTCINITAFWYSNAIYNILTDLVILLSVPGVVWGLHLPLRQRLALTLVFGLGIFVFATSVLRFTTLDVSSRTHDATAGTLISTMWTTIEASCALVCACLPMVRTPLQRLWPKLFGTTRRETTSDSFSNGGSRPPTSTHIEKTHSREEEHIGLDTTSHLSAHDRNTNKMADNRRNGDVEMGTLARKPNTHKPLPTPKPDLHLCKVRAHTNCKIKPYNLCNSTTTTSSTNTTLDMPNHPSKPNHHTTTTATNPNTNPSHAPTSETFTRSSATTTTSETDWYGSSSYTWLAKAW